MAKTTRGVLRQIATRGVIAALPLAIASAYASGLFIEPPRLAEAKYQTVAEITTTPTTVGVATSPLYGQPKALIEQQLDDLLSIGVTSIRVFVPWGLVEPADNFYNWGSIDDIMSAAAARNMGVLAQVNATPIWGGVNGPGFPLGSGEPNVGAFTDFMGVFANRYGTTVSAYEIWNEPNYYQFFNPISPEAYTNLLKAVYPILKAADPTATVVAGAVGATQTFGGFTMSPVEFVQRMLAAGAVDFFDALSVHPYGDQIPYSGSCPSCPSNVLTPRQQVEAIMGMLTGKKVWITEYGVATGPLGVDEAQQAAWLKDLLDHWQTYDPDSVGPVFLYTIRDALIDPNDPTNLENFFGLWDALGNEKDAVDMLRDWIAAHPQPVTPPPPTQAPANPLAQLFAALQQMVQSFQQAITNLFNPGGFIQSFVNAISNLFGFLRPPAPATTLSAPAVEGPEAAMRTAAFVSEPEAGEAVDGEAVDGEAVDGEAVETVTEKTVTDAVDSAATELAVEPVAEPVVEPVVETVVEPEVIEPVAVEPEVAPVVTPEVETTPEATPAASDVDSEGKASTDSSSASAAKPATESTTSAKSDDDGESSFKSGVSTSRMTPTSESTSSPTKTEDKSSDNDKPEAVSVTAGASSSTSSSSEGSSSDTSSSGSDD